VAVADRLVRSRDRNPTRLAEEVSRPDDDHHVLRPQDPRLGPAWSRPRRPHARRPARRL